MTLPDKITILRARLAKAKSRGNYGTARMWSRRLTKAVHEQMRKELGR